MAITRRYKIVKYWWKKTAQSFYFCIYSNEKAKNVYFYIKFYKIVISICLLKWSVNEDGVPYHVSIFTFRMSNVHYAHWNQLKTNVILNLYGSWFCHSFDPFSKTRHIKCPWTLFYFCCLLTKSKMSTKCVHFNQPYWNVISALRFYHFIEGNREKEKHVEMVKAKRKLYTVAFVRLLPMKNWMKQIRILAHLPFNYLTIIQLVRWADVVVTFNTYPLKRTHQMKRNNKIG